jgi:hypothetical protein
MKSDTAPCPHCGRQVYDDAERCPYCENYISEEDTPPSSRKPWWLILGVLACMYAVYRWITMGG